MPRILISARTYLLILSSLIFTPLLVCTAVLLYNFFTLEQERATTLAQSFSVQAAATVDAHLERGLSILVGLGSSAALARDDLATFYSEAERVAKEEKAVILLRGLNAEQYLNTQLSFGSLLPPAVELRKDELASFAAGKNVISNIYKSPVGN